VKSHYSILSKVYLVEQRTDTSNISDNQRHAKYSMLEIVPDVPCLKAIIKLRIKWVKI